MCRRLRSHIVLLGLLIVKPITRKCRKALINKIENLEYEFSCKNECAVKSEPKDEAYIASSETSSPSLVKC